MSLSEEESVWRASSSSSFPTCLPGKKPGKHLLYRRQRTSVAHIAAAKANKKERGAFIFLGHLHSGGGGGAVAAVDNFSLLFFVTKCVL